MTRTIAQVVSCSQQKARFSGWARIGTVATILAFCPAFLPVASANCRNGSRPQGAPSMPGGFAGQSGSHGSSNSKNPVSIVGLWNVNFLSGGEVVDVAFDAWHSDGTEILNDYTDPIEGNVCLGVWQQTGPRAYKLKHPSWYFDTTGTLQGTVIIRETVHLSPDGNSYSGSYAYDIFDVKGNFLEELTGQIQATRIVVD